MNTKINKIPQLNGKTAMSVLLSSQRLGRTMNRVMKNAPTGTISEMVQLLNYGFEYKKEHFLLEVDHDCLVVSSRGWIYRWVSNGYWLSIYQIVIATNCVKVDINGFGDLEIGNEVQYSFEELGIGDELNELCLQDQITEIIDATSKKLRNDY